MTYDAIRALCKEAREQERSEAGIAFTTDGVTTRLSEAVWVASARSREPRLAALLEAAVEVVVKAEAVVCADYTTFPAKEGDLAAAISRFRALAQEEPA